MNIGLASRSSILTVSAEFSSYRLPSSASRSCSPLPGRLSMLFLLRLPASSPPAICFSSPSFRSTWLLRLSGRCVHEQTSHHAYQQRVPPALRPRHAAREILLRH